MTPGRRIVPREAALRICLTRSLELVLLSKAAPEGAWRRKLVPPGAIAIADLIWSSIG
jgi:hypothetical protein